MAELWLYNRTKKAIQYGISKDGVKFLTYTCPAGDKRRYTTSANPPHFFIKYDVVSGPGTEIRGGQLQAGEYDFALEGHILKLIPHGLKDN